MPPPVTPMQCMAVTNTYAGVARFLSNIRLCDLVPLPLADSGACCGPVFLCSENQVKLLIITKWFTFSYTSVEVGKAFLLNKRSLDWMEIDSVVGPLSSIPMLPSKVTKSSH